MPVRTDCPCQSTLSRKRNSIFYDFKVLRNNCPALKKILLPDSIWFDVEKKVEEGFDEAGHWPITLKALWYGYLGRITAPFHRHLLVGGEVADRLTSQYRSDLAEKWVFEKTLFERHKKSRIFQGKLAELLAATWMENQGWTVGGLAALGAEFDVEAKSPDSDSYSIEVKYIGHEDVRFQEMVDARSSGNSAGGPWDVHEGYNYILFRAYEAARQLLKSDKKRLALIIISNNAWDFLELPIEEGWIAERPITFINSGSHGWNEFLEKKKEEKKFADIDSDLNHIVNQVDKLWIVKEENYLDYSLQYNLPMVKS